VLCVTGNGLKTTDVLADRYEATEPIRPRLADFEAYLQSVLDSERQIPEKVVA
jgi:threonine synthase